MAKSETSFKKGESGNPSGRPPKNRALTQILEAAGDTQVKYGDKKLARKQVLAQILWQVATTGQSDLPDGKKITVAPQDWFGVVKFLYSHIDGAPRTELDVTTNGESIIPILKTGMDLDEI